MSVRNAANMLGGNMSGVNMNGGSIIGEIAIMRGPLSARLDTMRRRRFTVPIRVTIDEIAR